MELPQWLLVNNEKFNHLIPRPKAMVVIAARPRNAATDPPLRHLEE